MPKGYPVNIDPPNPSGLCQCGCNQPTPLARQSDIKTGNVKGHPIRFIHNHHRAISVKYVEKDQGCTTLCHVWLLSVDKDGYGNMSPDGRDGGRQRAHRFYYEKAKGPIPAGMDLDHLCHNPKTCIDGKSCPHRRCINPDHLEPVTSAENTARGLNRKLSTEDISGIKEMRSKGIFYAKIAQQFGVTTMTIFKICKGQTYRGVG